MAEAAILRAAMELFVECGMEGATIEQIAARAGVARTTIYRRWSTREALLVQAIADARKLPDQMGAGVESLQADDLLNMILRTGAELLTQRQFRQLAARLIGALPDHPSLMVTYEEHVLLPRRLAFRKVLERAQAIGVVPADSDLDLLMDILSGVAVYRLLFQPEERDPATVQKYLLQLFHQLDFRLPRTAESGGWKQG
jgi:AcrR family transcriptional regulator